MRWMARMRSMLSYLRFWKGDKNVPGVADVERRTKAAQEQKTRKSERDNLLVLIAEGRLHEADAAQIEQIKLALELGELLNHEPQSTGIDADQLAAALKGVVTDLVAAMPKVIHTSGSGGGSVEDTSRPGMKHTSLSSITHKDSEINISHGDALTVEKEGDEDAGEKLKRLREIKGSK